MTERSAPAAPTPESEATSTPRVEEPVAAPLGSDSSAEYRRTVEILGKVGLTVYEARAYIALVARGVGDAATLAQAAKIPRTSAYKVLESLAEKGYASPTGGKPILFRPKPPLEVAESLKGSIQEVFEGLDALHRMVAEHGEPQLVYLLAGRERVLGKIGELLDQSTRDLTSSRRRKSPRSATGSRRRSRAPSSEASRSPSSRPPTRRCRKGCRTSPGRTSSPPRSSPTASTHSSPPPASTRAVSPTIRS